MKNDGNKKKIANKRDANKVLEVLFEISEAVTSTLSLDELYKVIHTSLGKILNVDNFYIALHHEGKDSISFPYHVDEKDENPDEIFNFSKTASLTGKVINAREPLIFYEQDIIDFAILQNQQTIGTVSKIWIGAPLIIKERVIGAIAMQSFHSSKDYQEKDLSFLNTISQHIALAIERKESKDKLKEQQQVLEKIIESSPVGICLVEKRFFKWINNEMLNMFEYEKKEEFENANVRMIYGSDDDYNEAGNIIYHDLKDTGKSDFDFNLIKKDGSTFKAHIIITSSSSENPFESTIVTFADISQRELAQKEKLEREKLQGVLEMAGAVCHEINQPLQTIVGYSTLYKDSETITPEELHNIKTQASRIGDITKRLSNITHYKTVTYPGDTKIVDIWGSSNDTT
ncbi:MAG: GAF domain-containing protein [Desulfobacteraceae bacterium]|nr:GAF domain-containing protein [Desulfobacteraceae bacterium]